MCRVCIVPRTFLGSRVFIVHSLGSYMILQVIIILVFEWCNASHPDAANNIYNRTVLGGRSSSDGVRSHWYVSHSAWLVICSYKFRIVYWMDWMILMCSRNKISTCRCQPCYLFANRLRNHPSHEKKKHAEVLRWLKRIFVVVRIKDTLSTS